MRRGLTTGFCALGVVLATATTLAIGTIKELSLKDGRDEVNTLTGPAVDGSSTGVTIGTVTGTFDKGAKIVRRGATGFMTRGPEYNLDKSLDLAGLFATALKEEAAAMGFRAGGADAWEVGATIKDVYVESKQIPYGATLFHGFMDVEVTVGRTGTAPQPVRLRLYNYNGGYNAGMGRKDEAAVALAHLLVEGAQELLARLNRTHFKAPAHPAIGALVEQITAAGEKRSAATVHRVGLSGSPAAATAILALVPKEADENRRYSLIEALARLGAADAVPVLSQRYATEDEDCRVATLKAMDYIGGSAAEAVLNGPGVGDGDGGPRRLAEKATGKAKK